MKLTKLSIAMVLSISGLTQANAEDLSLVDGCFSHAILTQIANNETHIRAINLTNGSIVVKHSKKVDIKGKINGIGFNVKADPDKNRGYYYGMNMTAEEGEFIKIIPLEDASGNISYTFDYIPLTTDNPDGEFFKTYAGDFDRDGMYYGFYNTKDTLYAINANQNEPNYLKQVKIGTGNNPRGNLGDVALNNDSNYLYGFSNGSNEGGAHLIKIDKTNGEITDMGSVNIPDEKGFFGAAYFAKDDDDNAFLYVSNNKSGKTFKVDIEAVESGTLVKNATVLDSNGFFSQANDGGRCFDAPLEQIEFDYGHAPRASSINNMSPARANVFSNYFMGASITEDSSHGQDSGDDGVTGLNFTEDAPKTITITIGGGADAYVSAWIDYNNDQIFQETEKVIKTAKLSAGANDLTIVVPKDIYTEGKTWMRFRTSSEEIHDMSAYGATGYGEVEDYEIEIEERASDKTYFPSDSTYATAAFEDKWPVQGDYDFNDVVVQYRTENTYKGNKLIRVDVYGKLISYGASYENGFALELKEGLKSIKRENIDLDNVVLKVHGAELDNSNVIGGTNPSDIASIRLLENIKSIVKNEHDDLLSFDGTCLYNDDEEFYRSTQLCGDVGEDLFFFASIPMQTTPELRIKKNDSPNVFKPYVYSTEGKFRFASPFSNLIQQRGLEIHLKNKEPSINFLLSDLFGTSDDTSDGSSIYFSDVQGMPWVLLIPKEWNPPTAGLSILTAYPQFRDFALDASGSTNSDWYDYPVLPPANGIVSDIPYVDRNDQ